MSNWADHDSLVSVAKVRLVTFDGLPFTDDLSASEAVYDAMDRLSADGVFFENHYLQTAGFRGVTQGFSLSGTEEDSSVRLLVFGSGSKPAANFDSLPDLLAAEFCGPFTVASDLPDDDFCWLHFESGDDGESGQAAAGAGFEAVLPLIHALLHQQCVVFVTSLSGQAPPPSRFESVLAESLIHAPLWVLGTGQDRGRVQGVTGSSDVGYSIQRLMRNSRLGDSAASEGSQPIHDPIDLTALCAEPGQLLEREVLIEHDGVNAVRGNDFLLVHCPPSPDAELREYRTALYAKPEDVWNLNDVAGEYQAVVDGLKERSKSRFAALSAESNSAEPHD